MRVLIALFAVLASSLAFAQQAPAYQAGKHYHEIATPVRTSNPDKIELAEVFWYGCGHCYTFAPHIAKWESQAPDDVVVVHSPAIWRDVMETHARIYYTAKALGKLDDLHMAVFRAMHEEGKRLASENEVAALFVKHGVDKEKFHKTFNSFGVKSQVQQADARQRSFGVTGTPALVVNGRYRISGADLAGGQEEMLKVAEFLIEQIRTAKQ